MHVQPAFPDTIYALSSGGLPSGVAVIRLSGVHCELVLQSMTGFVPDARTVKLATIRNRNGSILDQGLALFFKAPASFTGEDCAELHLHGGRAVVGAVLTALSEFPGLREAEAGEFTRRAFINGKLDLTRAEGLADLIAAETEAERRLAIATSGGTQERLYNDWRERLLHARALVEADLDFSDESDIPGSVADRVWAEMAELADEIERHLAGFRTAEIIREGFNVVIVGPPNAGKSSLLNAIAGREAAIVTDIPGTTRDIVRIEIDLRGQRVVFSDTAGLRESADEVERIGIERAVDAARKADLVLELFDASESGREPGFTESIPDQVPRLRVGTKLDLVSAADLPPADHLISARQGSGLEGLLKEIRNRAASELISGDNVIPTRERHVAILRDCVAALRRAPSIGATEAELGAEELRQAAHALGRLTGATDVEDILGAIFSTFCVGK
jgi:tRNA modification GTPase